MTKLLTILTVDIGGTFMRAALVQGTKIVKKTAIQTPHDGIQSLLQKILHLKQQLESETELLAGGVAVAFASVVEPQSGIVEKSSKFGIEKRTDLQKLLLAATGLPAIVRTELSMAALGEISVEEQDNPGNMVVLTVGTGLGAGIILQGRVYYGTSGFAGEIGHIPIVRSSTSRSCPCGRRGCLESYAASRSVTRSVGAGPWNSPEEAVSAAQKGDSKALLALYETGRYIGLAATICANTYDPARIILRGGFVRAIWPLIFKEIYQVFAASSLSPSTTLMLSQLNEDGVFWGLRTEWSSSRKNQS
jgi:glucokinase